MHFSTHVPAGLVDGARGHGSSTASGKAVRVTNESHPQQDFFLFNSNNYTFYPSDMDNKYIFV
jgi:hypothetical protein